MTTTLTAGNFLTVGKLVSKKNAPKGAFFMGSLAEEEGFEPSVVLPLRLISSQVHSTTLPPLRIRFHLSKPIFYQAESVSKPPK